MINLSLLSSKFIYFRIKARRKKKIITKIIIMGYNWVINMSIYA